MLIVRLLADIGALDACLSSEATQMSIHAGPGVAAMRRRAFASWNQTMDWIRALDSLRGAA
jgi:hypothetical protein